MRRCDKHHRMMICETPDETLWAQELAMVKSILQDTFDIEQFHKQHYKTDVLAKFQNLHEQS